MKPRCEGYGSRLRTILQNEPGAEHSDCYRDVIRRADMESANFVCHAVLAPAGLVARLRCDGCDHVECRAGTHFSHYGDVW